MRIKKCTMKMKTRTKTVYRFFKKFYFFEVFIDLNFLFEPILPLWAVALLAF